jgi:murein DD-endopeptidase MepM/ murein hydrolase activator NlpD
MLILRAFCAILDVFSLRHSLVYGKIKPIPKVIRQLYRLNTPLTVAVFLIGACLLAGSLFFKKTGVIEEKSIISGASPSLVASAEGAELGQVALVASGGQVPPPLPGDVSTENSLSATSPEPDAAIAETALQDTTSPVNPSFVVLQAGVDQAAAFAPMSVGLSASGTTAITVKLPNFNKDFIMPANGYNWGILDNDNGIDIANSCGAPVVAAADGLVVPDANIPDVPGGWNDGYGNFVLLQHSFGNNVMTRYANLQTISVQIGDYVTQGEVIGLMGQTGGVTECHVHFEVIRAQNPFVKKQ